MSKVLFHLHPPKTGGKSIETHLVRALGSSVLRVSREFPEVSIGDVANYREAFAGRDRKDQRQPAVVTGHFCFGLHEAMGLSASYVSIIRHPAARLKSYYNYIMNSDDYFVKDFIIKNSIGFEQLAQLGDGCNYANYPEEFNIMVENGQSRLLAGITGKLSDPLTEAEFSIVAKNIDDSYAFLAPTNRGIEAYIAMCGLLNIQPSLRYRKVNTGSVDHVGPISPELQSYISERNKFDVALFGMSDRSFENFLTDSGLRVYVKKYNHILKMVSKAYETFSKIRL